MSTGNKRHKFKRCKRTSDCLKSGLTSVETVLGNAGGNTKKQTGNNPNDQSRSNVSGTARTVMKPANGSGGGGGNGDGDGDDHDPRKGKEYSNCSFPDKKPKKKDKKKNANGEKMEIEHASLQKMEVDKPSFSHDSPMVASSSPEEGDAQVSKTHCDLKNRSTVYCNLE